MYMVIWGDEMATLTTAAQPHLSNPPSAALGTLAPWVTASVAPARGWQNFVVPEVVRTNRAGYPFQSGFSPICDSGAPIILNFDI